MRENKFYTQFDSVFFEKTRLSMLTILYNEGSVSFNRFKKLLGGTDGAIYSHIRKLINAGYIVQKKGIFQEKIQTNYSLTEKGRMIFREYLKFLSDMFEDGVMEQKADRKDR